MLKIFLTAANTYIYIFFLSPQLIAVNKRSAMLLDRLMYNLKEIMKKLPKDPSEDDLTDGVSDHSSEIRGLRSTKCSSETLQNLLYFIYKKTHVVFFVFHFVGTSTRAFIR